MPACAEGARDSARGREFIRGLRGTNSCLHYEGKGMCREGEERTVSGRVEKMERVSMPHPPRPLYVPRSRSARSSQPREGERMRPKRTYGFSGCSGKPSSKCACR